jgi:hypothetical protein
MSLTLFLERLLKVVFILNPDHGFD